MGYGEQPEGTLTKKIKNILFTIDNKERGEKRRTSRERMFTSQNALPYVSQVQAPCSHVVKARGSDLAMLRAPSTDIRTLTLTLTWVDSLRFQQKGIRLG